MYLARLLAAPLLLISLAVLAQEQPGAPRIASSSRPDRRLESSTYNSGQESDLIRLFPPAEVQPAAEGLCYTIRSYVVARDEKNSDSTHVVKASTCQPARKFQLKSARSANQSVDR